MSGIRRLTIEIIVDSEALEFVFTEVKEVEIQSDDSLNAFHEDRKKYHSEDGTTLEIVLSKGLCIECKVEKVSLDLFDYENELIHHFIETYNGIAMNQFENISDGVEPEESDRDSTMITAPYDPNTIRVTQARFSLKEIYEMINGTEDDEPMLDISPDFQRNFVWDYTRKARLIESILLKIPLPVFYFARDNDGKFQVIDGVQRLNAIEQFFSNKYKLKNLEYLNDECEGKYMKNGENSLHPKFYRALRSYQVDCNIIEPDTPYRVKLDIFKRLNTGGKSLNRQEIRHSIMKPIVRNYIKELTSSEKFKEATDGSIKPTRMIDQELILRFLGFYIVYDEKLYEITGLEYESNMNDFLDNVVDVMNSNMEEIPLKRIKKEFDLSMIMARKIFEEYAFRKVENRYRFNNRNMINKSLFTAFSVLLYQYSDYIEPAEYIDDFVDFLDDEPYLLNSITYATNDSARIDTTFLKISEFLEYLEETYPREN